MVDTILLSTASARSSCTIDPTEIAFCDFKNGVYRFNGASCPIGTLWTENVSDWGTFTPAEAVVPGSGLVAGDNDSPTATVALFNALWPDGFVALLTAVWSDVASTMIFDIYKDTSFAEEYRIILQSNNVLADYKPTQDGISSTVADPGNGSVLRSVIRMTPTKISAMHASGETSVYRRPGATPDLTKFSIGLNNGTVLRDITFFSPDVPFMDLLV